MKWVRHMADYSQKEKELEREHLEKLVKEEDRSIKPMKEFESPEDIYELISSVSYPNAKAKHLAQMSRQLVELFGGEVPEDADDLVKLAGVGRKTANVIRAVWFGHATMAVDTHVYRVSHRMGLVPRTADTPRKVEDYLMKHIPAEDIPNAHHWILLHGRYICKSAKPLCDKCFFNEYCPKLLKDSKL